MAAPGDLPGLLAFTEGLEGDLLFQRLAGQAWEVGSRLGRDEKAKLFFWLGFQLQTRVKDYDGADKAFRKVLDEGGPEGLLARSGLHRAGLLIHVLNRPQEAWDLLAALSPTVLAESQEVELRAIYLADAAAALGRREEAQAMYEKLREVVPLTDRGYALRRRARLFNIRDYIRRQEFEAAIQELNNIEWETPKERMGDETGLLRAEALLAQKDFRKIVPLAERLLKINPTSPRVPEMHLILLKAYLGLGEVEKAKGVLSILRKGFPYSAESALGVGLLEK
jgi:tetratricopeptide (TPR) repeat protein